MNISIYNSLNAAHPSLFIDSDEQNPLFKHIIKKLLMTL